MLSTTALVNGSVQSSTGWMHVWQSLSMRHVANVLRVEQIFLKTTGEVNHAFPIEWKNMGTHLHIARIHLPIV
jgi:hypothetical protein